MIKICISCQRSKGEGGKRHLKNLCVDRFEWDRDFITFVWLLYLRDLAVSSSFAQLKG